MFDAARGIDGRRKAGGAMFIGDDDLHEVESVVERRDGAQHEEDARGRVEIIVNRANQSLARENDLWVTPVAHFECDCLRAGQYVAVRQLNQTEPAGGEYVARESRVGMRA